jgi:uncharacterized membrane protein
MKKKCSLKRKGCKMDRNKRTKSNINLSLSLHLPVLLRVPLCFSFVAFLLSLLLSLYTPLFLTFVLCVLFVYLTVIPNFFLLSLAFLNLSILSPYSYSYLSCPFSFNSVLPSLIPYILNFISSCRSTFLHQDSF